MLGKSKNLLSISLCSIITFQYFTWQYNFYIGNNCILLHIPENNCIKSIFLVSLTTFLSLSIHGSLWLSMIMSLTLFFFFFGKRWIFFNSWAFTSISNNIMASIYLSCINSNLYLKKFIIYLSGFFLDN